MLSQALNLSKRFPCAFGLGTLVTCAMCAALILLRQYSPLADEPVWLIPIAIGVSMLVLLGGAAHIRWESPADFDDTERRILSFVCGSEGGACVMLGILCLSGGFGLPV